MEKYEIKNPIYAIQSKLDRAEEKISELEDGTESRSHRM